MNNTAAIFYKADGFETRGKRLLGRQAAGEGFLKALVQHALRSLCSVIREVQMSFQNFVSASNLG
jgi:alpha-maltose-1-phosphate synthase